MPRETYVANVSRVAALLTRNRVTMAPVADRFEHVLGDWRRHHYRRGRYSGRPRSRILRRSHHRRMGRPGPACMGGAGLEIDDCAVVPTTASGHLNGPMSALVE